MFRRLPQAVPGGLVLAAALMAPGTVASQTPDSVIVVEVMREVDSALVAVLEAFAEADIDVAVSSAPQGLVLSRTERMGRQAPFSYAQFRADLVPLGPITRVELRGIVAPNEDLDRPVTVTSGSFFQGALVWARLQWVGRELRKLDDEPPPGE